MTVVNQSCSCIGNSYSPVQIDNFVMYRLATTHSVTDIQNGRTDRQTGRQHYYANIRSFCTQYDRLIIIIINKSNANGTAYLLAIGYSHLEKRSDSSYTVFSEQLAYTIYVHSFCVSILLGRALPSNYSRNPKETKCQKINPRSADCEQIIIYTWFGHE